MGMLIQNELSEKMSVQQYKYKKDSYYIMQSKGQQIWRQEVGASAPLHM